MSCRNILITDLRMGGMDGLQLFEAVHRRYPLLPVLILTANGTIRRRGQRACAAASSATSPSPSKARDLMARGEPRAGGIVADPGRRHAHRRRLTAGEAWREAIITRSPRMQQLLAEARHHGAERRLGAHPRRERHRQGVAGARAARLQRALA
jgi:two-component system response regulator GlrR